jgi:hypothetical protein
VLLFYNQADDQAFSFQETTQSPELPWYEISEIQVSEGRPYSYESNALPDNQPTLSFPPRYGSMELLGYKLPQEAKSGSSFVVPFYWKVLVKVEPELELVINWRDNTGRIWLSTLISPGSTGNDLASWPVGALRRCLYTLEVPASAPPGKSDLYLLIRLRGTNNYLDLSRWIIPMLHHAFHLGSIQID